MKKTTYAAIKMNIYLKGFTSKGDGLSHFKRIVLFIDPNLNQKKDSNVFLRLAILRDVDLDVLRIC